MVYYYNEKLDHVLGSCIVEMVHVVKVVNIVGSRYIDSDHPEPESGSRPR